MLNPRLNADRIPLRRTDAELFVLRRGGVELELKAPSGVHTGKGELYLTNLRLVFVCEKPSEEFSAADLPLQFISRERFNQPIFSANNLTGCADALENGGFGGRASFALYFKQGVGTFLPLFFSLLKDTRARAADPKAPQLDVSRLVAQAFVDPSDPSFVYVAQPKQEREECC